MSNIKNYLRTLCIIVALIMTATVVSPINAFAKSKSVPARVWDFFRSQGFSAEATAGIMGNCDVESGFKTTAGYAGSYGLFQTSKNKLAKFARKKGLKTTDAKAQCLHAISSMKYDLSTFSGRKRYKYPGKYVRGKWKDGGYVWWAKTVTLNYTSKHPNAIVFKKISNVKLASDIFCACCERPHRANYKERARRAQKWYKKYKNRAITEL